MVGPLMYSLEQKYLYRLSKSEVEVGDREGPVKQLTSSVCLKMLHGDVRDVLHLNASTSHATMMRF